jgi:Fe-S oxidoreductase
LRDEYLEFFPKDPRATALAANTYLIEEFLTEAVDGQAPIEKLPFRAETASSLHLHTHCHTKALTGSAALITMLTAAGYAVTEIDSGCCGMAGSFGYEQEHYKLSMAIAEMRLLPAVRRALERGQAVTAQGVSCRTQIADGAGYPSRHPIELVADRL